MRAWCRFGYGKFRKYRNIFGGGVIIYTANDVQQNDVVLREFDDDEMI